MVWPLKGRLPLRRTGRYEGVTEDKTAQGDEK
jgi:hypothetical protein